MRQTGEIVRAADIQGLMASLPGATGTDSQPLFMELCGGLAVTDRFSCGEGADWVHMLMLYDCPLH